MTALAAVCAVAAMLLARPPQIWWVRHRLGRRALRRGPPRVLVLAAASVLLAPRLADLGGPRVVLVVTVGAVGWFVIGRVRQGRRRGAEAVRRGATVEMLGLLSAELRAGVLPHRALVGLAVDFPFLEPVGRAADLGGDVPSAFRLAAREPGRELLHDLAATWYVADRAGAPMSRVLDRLEESSRSARELEREVEAGVAPARATGRIMAVLPVVGLLLGSGMGGSPVGVLTGTWIGVLCLAAGSALACAGVAWVERIAVSAERHP